MEVDDFDLTSSVDFEEGELVEDGELVEEQTNDEEKKILRAKRFGIITQVSSDPKIAALHKKMGVDSNTRTEALHLLGTDTMKNEDVFAYFYGGAPASIEWISDNSCNAVWLDEKSCADALLKSSIHIKGQSTDSQEDNDEEEYIEMKDIRQTLPSGIWRKGRSFVLAPNLIMRYAKYSDKKNPKLGPDFVLQPIIFPDQGDEVGKKLRVESSNPWVDIAVQWGHFEHKSAVQKSIFEPIPIKPIRDAREILTKRVPRVPRKRRHDEVESDDKREIVLGKMHADVEEEKMYKKKRVQAMDLRSKLGRKRRLNGSTLHREIEDGIRVGLTLARERRTNWDSDSESSGKEDLREKLRRPSIKCKRKLRRKEPHVHSPLRIEIDNDVYFNTKDE